MISDRLGLVFGLELRRTFWRPLTWIMILVLALTAWGLSSGDMRISSGDSAVGGTKAWITSEFANGKMLSMVIFLFYSFFIAIMAGMAVMADDELKVGDLLHATPLRPGEYIWGKFLAIVACLHIVLVIHLLLAIFFNHVVPNAKAIDIRGPLALGNYLRPALVFGIPLILFIAGTSFAIGERTRKPILVFVLPVAAIMFCGFFLWSWSPSWLSPKINRLLMLIDPAGVRWLSETWLKLDRGVEFYNKQPIRFDMGFLLSRVGFAAIGLGSVLLGQRRFAGDLRGSREPRAARAGRRARPRGAPEPVAASPSEIRAQSLAGLGMRTSPPGLLRGALDVFRFELRELRSQPGLYLFAPIILLQTLGTALELVGAFDTRVLVTPGIFATRTMNTLTLLLCLLGLFYTVESLRRERGTGIAPIYFATPTGTASILVGKMFANIVIALVIMAATALGGVIALLVQAKVALDFGPFFLTWGLLLLPTFLLWTSFVTAAFAVTGNRYTTYGVGLAALGLTGYLQMTGKMTWVGNWDIWSAVLWSDMSVLELDRVALLWNRILALGLAGFFMVLAVRVFARHDRDATRVLHKMEPHRLGRSVARMLPFAAIPLAAIIALVFLVNQSFQGKAVEKRAKDYWKQNLATWKEAPIPGIAHADVDLDLDPARRAFSISGSFRLVNVTEKTLRRVPLTGGLHWEDVAWTMNGAEYKPEDRSRLYVFTPPAPLAPGDSVTIGFRYHGRFPNGVTKNGGGAREFVLPSGVVLTSFGPSFVPVVGYMDDVGMDDKNRYEPRVYPDDFYEGITKPAFGSGLPFSTRVKITVPDGFTANCVGTKTEESVAGGRRTVVWESDRPVRFFNVVAGRWKERRGEGTAIYYHPKHTYNIDEMTAAIDASRKYYSEWFMPFPWNELKLSEFPGLAGYAQGFPTNITFSEAIGFLTKSDEKSGAAFVVTAHESAHQWWGNILTPGEGPGGDVLSEGMSHFSTMLLEEQVKGARDRIEFCTRIEKQYGDDRQMDSERPLVKIDGSKAGDETVTYDKGGWVFWMLMNRMGREPMLAGLREFVSKYKDGPDYPVLQDFVASMRPFAPDSVSYDDFVDQWFFHVVVPEYKLSGARRTEIEATTAELGASADSAGDAGGVATDGTAAGASAAERWNASVHVRNVGSGRMPVEIAAVSGERFEKDGKTSATYREVRGSVTLGAGEEADVSIDCDFRPERFVVDPDARVLQLQRKSAVAGF
jgi:ABC-2 type transport system permease protein